MDSSDFAKRVTHAARTVARIELKRRNARKRLAALDEDYTAAQRALRLLVQAVEPYTPPTAADTSAAADAADGV